MAEDVGFEPTKVSLAGFQDRCTRPLCESSVGKLTLELASLKIESFFKRGVIGEGSATLLAYSGRVSNSSMIRATESV